MQALDQVREVYGVRRLWFDKNARSIQVEYDASRLRADDVAALLREAGVALRERSRLHPMTRQIATGEATRGAQRFSDD